MPLGSVRVSLGWMSTFEDVWAVVDFVERTYRNREAEAVVGPRVVAADA